MIRQTYFVVQSLRSKPGLHFSTLSPWWDAVVQDTMGTGVSGGPSWYGLIRLGCPRGRSLGSLIFLGQPWTSLILWLSLHTALRGCNKKLISDCCGKL